MAFFRPTIDTLHPYVPGGRRQTELVSSSSTPTKTRTPEPEGAGRAATARGRPAPPLPAPLGDELREAVAEVLEVDPTWVLPGNGSDDLLTMLVRAVAGPGRPVVYPTPTYVLYRTLAEIQDAPVVEVPFDDRFVLPVEQLAAAQGALTFRGQPEQPVRHRHVNPTVDRARHRARGATRHR